MAEYVTKEQVIDWYRPYGQTDEHIPFETLVSDLRDMKAADVAMVRHGRWEHSRTYYEMDECNCSLCGQLMTTAIDKRMNYCPNCGAKMDLVDDNDTL